MLETAVFNRERMAAAAADEMIAAVDVADLLVGAGVPFREAHGIVAGLVRLAVGIEGIDDILADLELGFTAARPSGGIPASSAGDPHAVAAF